MKLRRQNRQDNGINLTPLIDVVFLLLIFFMVSTTFTRETRLKVELPDAQGERVSETLPETLEIIVDRDGGYAVNGGILVNRTIDTLIAALKQASGSDTSLPVIISADAEAPHRSVVTVMDAVGRLGFSQLSIATQEPQETQH